MIESSFLFVKIKFEAASSGIFGLILVKIDYNLQSFFQVDSVVVSMKYNMSFISNTSSLIEYYNFIIDRKLKDDYRKTITNNIEHQIKETLTNKYSNSEEIVRNIILSYDASEYQIMNQIFRDILERVTAGDDLTINIAAELLTESDINKAGRSIHNENTDVYKEINKDNEKDQFFYVPDQNRLVEANIVIEPLAGIPMFLLKKNDILFISLNEESIKNRSLLFKALEIEENEESYNMQILAKILKIEKNNNNILILTEFLNKNNEETNFFGAITEGKNIKVKVKNNFNTSKTDKLDSKQPESSFDFSVIKKFLSNNFIYLVIFFIFIAIVFLVTSLL